MAGPGGYRGCLALPLDVVMTEAYHGSVSEEEMTEMPAPASFAPGDGATLHFWTDAHAYTVTKVSASGKTITIQRDKATPDPSWTPDFSPGGFVGHTSNDRQRTYTYEPDPSGTVHTARLTARGWRVGGQRGQLVTAGRHEFYDSNF